MTDHHASIDAYIAAAAPSAQAALQQIRQLVHEQVPGTAETISYRMPAFRLGQGRKGRTFFYFAAFKRHIGVFPPVQADQALVRELQPWRGEKGNLRFPLDQPLPLALIGRVVCALAAEYSQSGTHRDGDGSSGAAE